LFADNNFPLSMVPNNQSYKPCTTINDLAE
jgi:hypothetical protein